MVGDREMVADGVSSRSQCSAMVLLAILFPYHVLLREARHYTVAAQANSSGASSCIMAWNAGAGSG